MNLIQENFFHFILYFCLSISLTCAIKSKEYCLSCKEKSYASHCEPNTYKEDCPEEDLDEVELVKEWIWEIQSLKVMVAVLLALVILLILLMSVCLLNNTNWKRRLQRVYSKAKGKTLEAEKAKDAEANANAVVIPNYAVAYSPSTPCGGPKMTSSIRGSQGPAAHLEEIPQHCTPSRRKRMPSESICPDNSPVEVSGYDNLGLSSSSISASTRPSSPTSPDNHRFGSVNSVGPLNTTTTTVNLDSIH